MFLVKMCFLGYTFDSVVAAAAHPTTTDQRLRKRSVSMFSIFILVIGFDNEAKDYFTNLADRTDGGTVCIITKEDS